MRKERVRSEFCIQCRDQFVSEWSEPQFTSYYLSSFDDVHLFRSKELAEKEVVKFPGSEIKKIKLTTIIELEE
ncbi:MAG: hypothetical protein RRZ64_00195 [Rikenellaceae bacterium]